jgi:hypothetical protein
MWMTGISISALSRIAGRRDERERRFLARA